MAFMEPGKIMRYLSGAVGRKLNDHMHLLVAPMSRSLTCKKLRDEVTETLQMLEANGVG